MALAASFRPSLRISRSKELGWTPKSLGRLNVVAVRAVKRVENDLFFCVLQSAVIFRGGRRGPRHRVQDFLGQIFGQNDIRRSEDQSPLDGVLQFAYVARPIVAHQAGLRCRRQRLALGLAFARDLVDEIVRQHRDVFAAFAERRHAERDHLQAIVEILAKGAGGHCFRQVAVGGGNQADIRL